MTGLDLGEVENFVDQMQQMPADAQDPLQRLDEVVEPVVLVVIRQHFRQADDGVQWRAQLVAHVGEELALGPGRFHCLIARLAQAFDELREFAFPLLAPGDLGIDRHHTAVAGSLLADLHPATVGEFNFSVAARLLAHLQPVRQPVRLRILRREGAVLDPEAHDFLEAGARHQGRGQRGVEVPVAAVRHDQSVVCVEQDEGFGNRLDRVLKLCTSLIERRAHRPLVRDITGIAGHAPRAAVRPDLCDAVLPGPAPAVVARPIADLHVEAWHQALEVIRHVLPEEDQVVGVQPVGTVLRRLQFLRGISRVSQMPGE